MDDVLRQFLDGVEGLGPEPDPERLTAAVHDLAVDLDYWRFHIERAGDSSTRSTAPSAACRSSWPGAPTAR